MQEELLDDRNVRVDEIGPRDGDSSSIAELACGRGGKASSIDPAVLAMICCVSITTRDLVGTIEIIAVTAGIEVGARLVTAVNQWNRKPRGDPFNERELPVAEHRVGHRTPVASEHFAVAEWQIIDEASSKAVIQVDLRQGPIEVLPVRQGEKRGAQLRAQAVG